MTSEDPRAADATSGASAVSASDPRQALSEDIPPHVSVFAPTGRVVAGTSTGIRVITDSGLHFKAGPSGEDEIAVPIAHYSHTIMFVDGEEVARTVDPDATLQVIFRRAGVFRVTASGIRTDGPPVNSGFVDVQVAPVGNPTFTVTAPAPGAVVDLGEQGGQVDVRLSIPSDQYFPLTVSIVRDGQSFSSEQTSSTSYQKTVLLGPGPSGPRTISVSVADRDNFTSTKSVTVTGHDVRVPRFKPIESLKLRAEFTGRANVDLVGAVEDTQSGMVGGSAAVAWSLSPSGARTPATAVSGNDFGTWRAQLKLNGLGVHTVHLWATNTIGTTTPTPATVQVTVSNDA